MSVCLSVRPSVSPKAEAKRGSGGGRSPPPGIKKAFRRHCLATLSGDTVRRHCLATFSGDIFRRYAPAR